MSYQIQPFETLPLRHKYMFGQVFQKPQICRMFLEELFGWDIERIEYVDREKDITDSYFSRGVRMDIYIRNSGVVYNVEMQSPKEKALERRVRFYQSGIDREELKRGTPISELPESYIIFICNYDPKEAGYAVYRRKSHWEDPTVNYDDGSHAIVLNSHYTEGNASKGILEFLDYIRTNDDSAEYTSEFARHMKKQVQDIRADREIGGKYMTFEMCIMDAKRDGGYIHLIELISRKIVKGKTPEVIAEELEEKLELVTEIYNVAVKFGPEYDADDIFEAWRDTWC